MLIGNNRSSMMSSHSFCLFSTANMLWCFMEKCSFLTWPSIEKWLQRQQHPQHRPVKVHFPYITNHHTLMKIDSCSIYIYHQACILQYTRWISIKGASLFQIYSVVKLACMCKQYSWRECQNNTQLTKYITLRASKVPELI